jgi:3-isopropylmalate dehydrogenase
MKLVVIEGEGIGPEITKSAMDILEAVKKKFSLDLTFEFAEAGLSAYRKTGDLVPADVMARVKAADGLILGPVDSYNYPKDVKRKTSVGGEFRTGLDLYANVRPARAREGLARTDKPLDLVIVRENTEGFYADRNMFMGSGEFMPEEGIALAVRKITDKGCTRIARWAFALARSRPRKKVTAVHKANVFKMSDGLFLKMVREVAKDYPDVELDDLIVDATAAYLIRDPSRFDVIVTTNMYGDILSDEASELSGSLGLAGSINAGDDFAMAQAQHGAAPDIAGQDKANPTSLVLSVVMLLDWLGQRHGQNALREASAAIEKSLEKALADPSTRTPDLGGPLGTKAFTKVITAAIG